LIRRYQDYKRLYFKQRIAIAEAKQSVGSDSKHSGDEGLKIKN
jgi:hypothetical protein